MCAWMSGGPGWSCLLYRVLNGHCVTDLKQKRVKLVFAVGIKNTPGASGARGMLATFSCPDLDPEIAFFLQQGLEAQPDLPVSDAFLYRLPGPDLLPDAMFFLQQDSEVGTQRPRVVEVLVVRNLGLCERDLAQDRNILIFQQFLDFLIYLLQLLSEIFQFHVDQVMGIRCHFSMPAIFKYVHKLAYSMQASGSFRAPEAIDQWRG